MNGSVRLGFPEASQELHIHMQVLPGESYKELGMKLSKVSYFV